MCDWIIDDGWRTGAFTIKWHQQTGSHLDRKWTGRPRSTSKAQGNLRNRRLSAPEIKVQLSECHGTKACTGQRRQKLVWRSLVQRAVDWWIEVWNLWFPKELLCAPLQRLAIPSGNRLTGQPFCMQQDDEPKHTSTLCQNSLKRKEKEDELKLMVWSPQSPDRNLIGLVWDRKVRKVKVK